jgi:hypothetical protein
MSTNLTKRKSVDSVTKQRLITLYELARSVGYPIAQAKRVAIQAIDRLQQGGSMDYDEQVERIRQHRATGGQAEATTFDRLLKELPPKRIPVRFSIKALPLGIQCSIVLVEISNRPVWTDYAPTSVRGRLDYNKRSAAKLRARAASWLRRHPEYTLQ